MMSWVLLDQIMKEIIYIYIYIYMLEYNYENYILLNTIVKHAPIVYKF